MRTPILIALATLLFTTPAFAKRANIWPSIPFVRGADLCAFHQAYGSDEQLLRSAQELMSYGAYGIEALELLRGFDELSQRQQRRASYQNYGVTLEASLKAFVDGYHRDLRPREKKVNFVARKFEESTLTELDFVAYGTYSLAPSCRGNLQVSLHLIGRDGITHSYSGIGHPSTVMSIIASQIYTDFQRTEFPSTLRIGLEEITLVGGLNGSVDEVSDLKVAELACESLDARLPDARELELINAYGDWSGGVSLNHAVWALPGGMVFHPGLRNPSPVRSPFEVNAKTYKYYCVR